MNEALALHNPQPYLQTARIMAEQDDLFAVISPDGQRYWLKAATSCLLRPQVSDQVLIAHIGQQDYILHILERPQQHRNELRIEGDLHLQLTNGGLSIETASSICLQPEGGLIVNSPTLSAHVADTHLQLQQLAVCGERFESAWHEQHQCAQHLTQQAVIHSAQYGDSWRHVEGHEEVQVQSARYLAQQDWSLHGKLVDCSADVTISMNAEKIKLG
jgi:hypothetical protein